MANKKEQSSTEDVSILSSGVKIEGKFYSDGNVRIDGEIKGEVTVNGNLTLGDSSVITGDIKAKNVNLSGNVEGAVHAAEKLVLDSKSSLKGDLFAKILVIQEGAKFEGKSTMSQLSQPAPKENK